MRVNVNINNAKLQCHAMRREARAKEFAPFDDVISKQIPGPALSAAEPQRELIRQKYHGIQMQIDQSETVEDLLSIRASLVSVILEST